jgi:hypothetical protein
MPFSITKPFVILSEGPADQTLFSALLRARGISNVDAPTMSDLGVAGGGVGRLGVGLNALSGDPSGWASLKGVLVIADSANTPAETFGLVCRKLRKDGPYKENGTVFVAPAGVGAVANQNFGPRIAIQTVPVGAPGALENLCSAAIEGAKPWITQCVEAYLACGQFQVAQWNAEKQAKARLQCIIAALYKSDPNKGLQYLLKAARHPIPFNSPAFTPIIREIRRFIKVAGGP